MSETRILIRLLTDVFSTELGIRLSFVKISEFRGVEPPKPPVRHYICYAILLTLYTATCFSPQRTVLRKCWYILWAGSTKCVSRYKYQMNNSVLYVTQLLSYCDNRYPCCSLTWYLHLDTRFVDPAHKMYQHFLRTVLWGLKHVAVYSVNIVVQIYIVH
jgi:hypothetical protein